MTKPNSKGHNTAPIHSRKPVSKVGVSTSIAREGFQNKIIPRSKMSWKYWSFLFRGVKVPGWILILWGLFRFIPDLKSQIDFWWDASHYLGGNVSTISSFLTSPWSSLLLIAGGITYLIFVDESDRPVFRHLLWTVLAWSIVGLLITAAFTVSIISYVTEQIGARHIFPLQSKIIHEILEKDAATPKTIGIIYVGTCFDCDGYADELADIISSVPGWRVVDRGTVLGPSRASISPFGIAIGDSNPSQPSSATVALQEALTAAKIPFELIKSAQNSNVSTEVIISARRRR